MAITAGGHGGRSWLALGGLAMCALGWQVACGPDAGAPVPTGATGALLSGIGPAVVLPALDTFESDVAALALAVEAWQSALDGGADGVLERTAAQDAWVSAMGSWQQLELMQVGPAASSLYALGGEDLRDEI